MSTTITEHEAEQVERANASPQTPAVFVHLPWLLRAGAKSPRQPSRSCVVSPDMHASNKQRSRCESRLRASDLPLPDARQDRTVRGDRKVRR